MQIECLRTHIVSGGNTYPVYIGFAPASEIEQCAVAPAFTRQTPNQQIAQNLLSQPVRDWQRPISAERVAAIADTFDDTGGFMPNPVLLAKNAFVSAGIQISPKPVANTPYQTGTFTIDVMPFSDPDKRPLWILDGQHRIAGLAASKQGSNPVPLVLLLDDGTGSYTSPLLANIFAQVTTAAMKLDELHNEWLTYAFQLGKYREPEGEQPAKAFRAVIDLCNIPDWSGIPNPFFNQVQFNEHVSVQPSAGGFSYKCSALGDLIARHYYGQPSQTPHMSPALLARELSIAYIALNNTVANHAVSVFFGTASKQQTIMQDAYLLGVLARALLHGPTADWSALLQQLNMHLTNWEFNWVRGLSGPANTASKAIAREVVRDALVGGSLPTGSASLADHLRGNGASVTLSCSSLSPAGRPRAAGRTEYTAQRGSTGSHAVGTTPHVRLSSKTSNVGEVQITDAKSSRVRYRELERRGLVMQTPLPRPLEIQITMQHYGDLVSQAEVQLNW